MLQRVKGKRPRKQRVKLEMKSWKPREMFRGPVLGADIPQEAMGQAKVSSPGLRMVVWDPTAAGVGLWPS